MLGLKYRLARKLVFDKLVAAFGGNLRAFISGGAPLSKDIAEFFYAADILILEEQSWDAIVEDILLAQEAEKRGLGATDDEVRPDNGDHETLNEDEGSDT